MKNSRTKFLEQTLYIKGYYNSLKALDLVIDEMSSEKGFKRHNNTDYYYHLVDVTQYILNMIPDIDEDTITAALLHDIVEDVDDISPVFIENKFNKNVATIVSLVTKETGLDYKNNPELMTDYLEKIKQNRSASIVKTADRVHNFSTMSNSSQEHRRKQLKNTKEYFIPFFKDCRKEYARNAGFFVVSQNFVESMSKIIEIELEK